MRTISKRFAHWLNVLLILTLLMGMLPPAQLAVASSPKSQTDEYSTPRLARWPEPAAAIDPLPLASRTDSQAAVSAHAQDEIIRAGRAPARTFALPFDFSYSGGSTAELPSTANGVEMTEPEGKVQSANFSNLGHFPMSFIPNIGQLDASVRFQAHGMLGTDLYFAPDEVILALPGNAADSSSTHKTVSQPPAALRLRFEGANPTPELVGGERLPGIVNYFIGNDPDRWQTNLPTYEHLVYEDLYPGIDLYYKGAEGALKGTYIVAPGTDPAQIRWRYAGAEQVRLDEATGNLLITLNSNPQAPLTEQAPVAWQEVEGQYIPITSRYTVTDRGVIGLVLGHYDPTLPITIDPTLDFSTYLGGWGSDSGASIAVDNAGNIYVTGTTSSSNFPYKTGSYSSGSNENVFITKIISASGVYTYGFSTYLGGDEEDAGNGIAVDDQGNVYVTGSTVSTSTFPTTTGALKALSSDNCELYNYDNGQNEAIACEDAFLVKLSASGSALLYSTYLGGNYHDTGHDIALDSNNNIYITGETRPDDSNPDPPLTSLDFPVVNAVQPTWGGDADAFVTKIISASGVYTYSYSTYLGGADSDKGYGIAVDGSGNAYITGETGSIDLQTRNELQPANQGGVDAFVTKIISASGVYTYGYLTYLGGWNEDHGQGIAVDSSSNAYITGYTASANFPRSNELQMNRGGYIDAFVTKIISASGVYTYGYSTYLGGTGSDFGDGITVDNTDSAYITGNTQSSNFPTTNALTYTYYGGDVFITKIISASGHYTYSFSTYLGGTSNDSGNDIAVTGDGLQVYVTGVTGYDFPTVSPTQPNPYNQDAFVSRIVWPSDLTLSFSGSDAVARVGQTAQYRLTVGNDSQATVSNLVLTQTLPAVISYTEASLVPAAVLTPTEAGQRLVWNLQNLAGSSFTTLVITGMVSLSAPVSSTLRTTATVSSNLAETNLTNNTVSFASTVQPGPLHHLALAVPQTIGLLAPFTATVSARDVAGNVVTGYTGAVTLTGTGQLRWYYDTREESYPIQQSIVSADHGSKTFDRLNLKPVGQQIITATDGTLVVTAPITVDNSLVIIDDYITWDEDEAEVEVGDLIIKGEGRLDLKGFTLITADNIIVESNGRISADEARDESGPGAGQSGTNCGDPAGGGGYGGRGAGPNNRGGPIYGEEQLEHPIVQGSDGGIVPTEGDPYPGKGGGAIHLVVTRTLALTGWISADGGSGSDGFGAGSGGSIWIEAGHFNGNGEISATGGHGLCGNSGGGGRIAVYADTHNFTGIIAADGGLNHKDDGRGSVYLSYLDLNHSGMVISPTNLAANGVDAVLVTVTLKISSEAPAVGRNVKLVVSPPGGTFINGQPATFGGVMLAPTDANGVTAAQITSTVSGVKQVEAQTINGVTISQTVAITFNPGSVDPSRSLVEFVDNDTAAANGVDSVAVRVTALDAVGNPIEGATVVLTSTAPVSLTQPPLTDAAGQTTGTITSTRVGTAPIRAIIGEVAVSQAVTATFGGADIAVRQTGPTQAVPGQPIFYNLTVENQGLLPANGVIVTDTLPIGVSYLDHSAPITPAINGAYVVWDLGTLASGANQTFALAGQVTNTLTAGEIVTNTVVADSLTGDEDSSNNTAIVTSTVIAPYSHTLTMDPETTTVSVGATERVMLTLRNTGPLADVYTVTVTGLAPGQYTPITANFPLNPGAVQPVDLDLHAPDCVPGTTPFTVTAYSQEGQLQAEATAELVTRSNPQQLGLVPANGSKSGSRSVLFNWRTDAPTTGTLTLQPSGVSAQAITRTTALSSIHTVLVENLSRNTVYTWTVRSVSTCGQTLSAAQSFTVSNGIVFTERTPATRDIAHDYNQRITMTLKNEDLSMTHTMRVTVEHPYDDLIVGFVGPGSVDDGSNYLVLQPGQSRDVILVVHAQNAIRETYHLTLKVIAGEGTADEIVDYAYLPLRVLPANQFELALRTTDSTTLVQTYVVTNTGYPITDLKIQAIDPNTGLPARALIQPAMEHAYLKAKNLRGSTLEFKVIPLFTPDDAVSLQAFARLGRSSGLASPLLQQNQGIEVEIVAGAGGVTQVISQTLGCSAPNQLYAITQRNVRLQFESADSYCTNQPNIDLNLPMPGSVNPSDVLAANLSSYFAPAMGEVKPHNMQMYFNPTQIASFNNTIPFGTYLFEVNPADLKPTANPASVVNQVVGIRSQHTNSGHYAVNSDTRLDLVMDKYTCYVCTPNEAQARSQGCSGVLPNPTKLDIQITQPVSGTNLYLGRPIALTAQVNDFLTQTIPYPVEALITYRDKPINGAPAKETIMLPYQKPEAATEWDAYRVSWTPAYTGDVSITAIVNATTISDSDTIDLGSNPEPGDLQVEILNQPDNPAEDQTVEIQARVTNLGGAINKTTPLHFEYSRLNLTATEQGASAQLTGDWVVENTHALTVPLQLDTGQSQIITDTYTIPAAGSYRVVVTANP